jgi:nitrite reductase/ring-hydroxylating ferredoxin subunit
MPIVTFKLEDLPAGFSTPAGFYAISQKPGQVTLFDMTCPHRGGPLTHGFYTNEDRIVCPWHGSRCNREKIERRTQPAIRNGDSVLFFTEQPLENVFVTIPLFEVDRRKNNETTNLQQVR